MLAPFEGAKVTVPALYMVGDRDLIMAFPGMDRVIANLANNVPRLRGKFTLANCGDWTPAGARVRGQRCDDRFLARVVSELAGRPATE